MKPFGRWLLSGLAGVAVTLLFNTIGVWWLGATLFTSHSFYDGCAAFLTLLIPAFLGGLALGWGARENGLNVAAVTFALFCMGGLLHPFWRIPRVMPESAHSSGMHYFLYNPIVALTFGSLGAWLMSQFVTGKYKLADEQPVSPPE